MFKVQCNEKDIIHIHAFGNGAEHHVTTAVIWVSAPQFIIKKFCAGIIVFYIAFF